jgi:hypothetical protein
MPIPFACAACGATTDVADDLADRRILCRHCNAPGRVPAGLLRDEDSGGPSLRPCRRALVRARGVVWTLCGLATLLTLIGLSASWDREDSAIRAAAAAAWAGARVAGFYVLARAVVAVFEAIEDLQR